MQEFNEKGANLSDLEIDSLRTTWGTYYVEELNLYV